MFFSSVDVDRLEEFRSAGNNAAARCFIREYHELFVLPACENSVRLTRQASYHSRLASP